MSEGESPEAQKPSVLIELIRSTPAMLSGFAAVLASLTALLALLLK
jgi:hypothetical protein